jgi:hypothetical protein
MPSKGPKFDIFSGQRTKNAVWIETVAGLSHALDRIEEIAAEKPGCYFLYSSSDGTIVLQIERHQEATPKSQAKGGSA